MSLVQKALEKVLQQRQAALTVEKIPVEPAAERAKETVVVPLAAPAVVPNPEPPRPAAPARSIRLDRESLRRDGLLPPVENERVLAYQYLQIKRRLIENAFGRRTGIRLATGNLIMVTSALAGDGKTFTTMNLALSLARETDTRVLLVDADVAKAHISRALGVEREQGLMDALRPDSNVESLILGTDVDGLQVLPAGTGSEHATELLASERMDKLLSELSTSRTDCIVLFDTPPLLITNEAPVLARNAGQIVLVVRAGVTPQQAVLDAAALLDEKKFAGLLFNQSHRSSADRYGYYDYGDRRDHGAGESHQKTTAGS